MSEADKMDDADVRRAIAALNRIMEAEFAGTIRYTHYSLMIYGFNRIPIASWLKENATEGLDHACAIKLPRSGPRLA